MRKVVTLRRKGRLDNRRNWLESSLRPPGSRSSTRREDTCLLFSGSEDQVVESPPCHGDNLAGASPVGIATLHARLAPAATAPRLHRGYQRGFESLSVHHFVIPTQMAASWLRLLIECGRNPNGGAAPPGIATSSCSSSARAPHRHCGGSPGSTDHEDHLTVPCALFLSYCR